MIKKLLITTLVLQMTAGTLLAINIGKVTQDKANEIASFLSDSVQTEKQKQGCKNLQSKFDKYAGFLKAGQISEAVQYAASIKAVCPGFVYERFIYDKESNSSYSNAVLAFPFIKFREKYGIVLTSDEAYSIYELGKPYDSPIQWCIVLDDILRKVSKYDDLLDFTMKIYKDLVNQKADDAAGPHFEDNKYFLLGGELFYNAHYKTRLAFIAEAKEQDRKLLLKYQFVRSVHRYRYWDKSSNLLSEIAEAEAAEILFILLEACPECAEICESYTNHDGELKKREIIASELFKTHAARLSTAGYYNSAIKFIELAKKASELGKK